MEVTIAASLSNEDYHASSAIGSSGLALVERSPAHYWAQYLDPNREPREQTPAMKLGSAWHCAVFEPGEFDNRYTAVPEGLDRRTKEGKDVWASIIASGKDPLSAADMERIRRMGEAARSHPALQVIFEQPGGAAEQSIFWTDAETGVALKVRPDYAVAPCKLFPNGLILDGKSCQDASPDGFAKNAWNAGMDLQAALYVDGFQQAYQTAEPPPFLWLAQEKESPFARSIYGANADLIEYGRKRYRRLLPIVAECQQAGNWPGYSVQVHTLTMPAWAHNTIQKEVAA